MTFASFYSIFKIKKKERTEYFVKFRQLLEIEKFAEDKTRLILTKVTWGKFECDQISFRLPKVCLTKTIVEWNRSRLISIGLGFSANYDQITLILFSIN